MTNEVRVVVTGQYKAGGAFSELDRDVKRATSSTAAFADRGVGRAEAGLERFRGVAAGASGVLAGVGIAAAGVTKVLNDGITVALTEANAEVALGEKAFGQLSAAADANANKMGFTRTEFLSTAGSAASLAKNLGFTQEASAKLGAAFPDLADKLAVLSNGKVTTAEAADQLRSAMAGEFDPLQSLGIAINAAAVETEALKIQQKSATEITKEQATSMAVLAIVQRQTADASKVMATEAGRAAAEAQENQAKLEEAYEDLSRAAIPILSEITEATARWLEGWQALFDGSTPLLKRVDELGKVMVPLTFAVDALTGKTKDQGDASQQTALDVMSLGEGAQGAAKSQEELQKEVEEATGAIREQAGVALDAREASRQWQESIDAARESMKENGRTLDITTEKGRANEAALDDMAEAALDVADSVVEAGGSEKDYRASLQRSREALVRQARAFGMTEAAAEEYADEVLRIPGRVRTTISSNVGAILGRARDLRSVLSAIDGSYIGVTIGLSGNGVGALGGFRTGGIKGAAVGGARPAGMTMVGEEGPELIPNMRPGTMVHERATTAQIMRRHAGAGRAGGGGGEPIVVNLVLDGMTLARALVDPTRRVVASLGGSVQDAYGPRGRAA